MKKLIVISAVWCPSCLILKKHLKRLKEEYKDIIIEVLDYDLDDIEQYNIGNTLPVVILDNNKEEQRLTGEQSYDDLINFLRKCDYL